MQSSHWSVRCWARSLVRTVLLIHRVSYIAEFQAVEVDRQFGLSTAWIR